MFASSKSPSKSSRRFPVTESSESPLEESSGIFDPVPALATTGVCGSRSEPAHDLEARVQRRLLSEPGLSFRFLRVHRVGDGGVCIEGVLSGSGFAPNINDLAAQVEGVQKVLNHILVCQDEE